jgi:sortase A
MSTLTRLFTPAPVPTRPLVWTLGNVLMLAGMYLLLYVGGTYAYIDYLRQAARGDSDIDVPQHTLVGMQESQLNSGVTFTVPALNAGGSAALPDAAAGTALVDRLMIPSIGVDSKVIEVGWQTVEQNGQLVSIWDVAEYAVGHHRGSANPRDGGNIVLAGHVGGYGRVFENLFYVAPGDDVLVYSDGQQYRYTVTQRVIVDEEGADEAQRLSNAAYIGETDSEMITMVTCWPLEGPNQFAQRIIVRAMPAVADAIIQLPPAAQTIR